MMPMLLFGKIDAWIDRGERLVARASESGLAPELQKAVIVYRGQLTGPYQYLNQYLS